MTLMFITSMLMSMILMTPMMMQPMSLGLNLMLMVSLTSVFMASFTSTWYSYMLFLIYVGGLLVMFAYVASIIPNHLFSSMKTMIMMIVLLFTFLYITSIIITPDTSTTETFSHMLSQKWQLTATPSYLISSHSFFIIVFLGLILFTNLLSVVKVCYYQGGPLRPFQMN
uniref:NADH dehydrogenase subunit 6 n=1 Tax=Cellana orientalis TaxID=351212 RepID=UPI0020287378|nr:NADH dehydrogenase subunit 6 [Cellana orientalis]UPX89393.1 NADH dehydrogenase subunit 6 [Cellana orientalis]